jgi:O-antigen/teichoic acid export membrane protein
MQNARPLQVRILHGSTASVLMFAVNLIGQVTLVPLFLSHWGNDRYGAWLTVSSAVALLLCLDLGHQTYVGALINDLYHRDPPRMEFVLGAAVRAAVLVAVIEVVVAVGLALTGLSAHAFGWSPAASSDHDAALITLVVLNGLQGSVGAIVTKLYAPAGDFGRSVYWAIARRMLDLGILALAVWLRMGLFGAALLVSVFTLPLSLAGYRDVYRKYPQFFPWWRDGSLAEGLKNLWRSAPFTTASVLEGLAINGTVLLVSARVDARAVVSLLTQRTIANILIQGSAFILQPLAADFGRYRARSEWSKLAESFGAFWLVGGGAVNLGLLVLLPIVQPFYEVWTRGRAEFDAQVFAGLAAAVVLRTVGAPFSSYGAAVNDLKNLAWSSAARAALALLGTLVLVKPLGVAGAALALALSELAGGLIVPTYVVALRFREAGAAFPTRSWTRAVLAASGACVCLFVFPCVARQRWIVELVAFAFTALLLVTQFRCLSRETSERLVGLLGLLRWKR